MNTLKQLGLCAICVVGVACGTFDPQPDPTQYYLMSPRATDAASSTSALQGMTLGVGPIWFAPYIMQRKLVTRVDENRVEFAEFDRWAEPFGEHFTRVLAQDLASASEPDATAVHPWFGTESVDVAVEMNVWRFDRTPDGGAVLRAEWSVRDGGSGEILEQQQVQLTQAAVGTGTNGAVRFDDTIVAMTQIMSRLADEIATALNREAPGIRARGTP